MLLFLYPRGPSTYAWNAMLVPFYAYTRHVRRTTYCHMRNDELAHLRHGEKRRRGETLVCPACLDRSERLQSAAALHEEPTIHWLPQPTTPLTGSEAQLSTASFPFTMTGEHGMAVPRSFTALHPANLESSMAGNCWLFSIGVAAQAHARAKHATPSPLER